MLKTCLIALVVILYGGPAWAQRPSLDLGRLPGAFPFAVWVQQPANAAKYRDLGINCYVGLWEGPTQQQLRMLKDAGMFVICAQNDQAMADEFADIVLAWMHGDEPDNAQSDGKGGYGPPVPPEKIVADYRSIKQRDPRRPVLLNLGQGVAWDGWYGRGERTNHPEDYPQYVEGCDIASFDIYPVTATHPDVAGRLGMVGSGVRRLREWAGSRPVWSCIETTRIDNLDRKPTPDQVRAEVWIAIASGAKGIIYFCHQFKPEFIEAGPLADEQMAAALKRINAEVQALCPKLADEPVEASSSDAGIIVLARKGLIVAVEAEGQARDADITVAGESRRLSFLPWEVKLLDE
jgi:hypothetical protein